MPLDVSFKGAGQLEKDLRQRQNQVYRSLRSELRAIGRDFRRTVEAERFSGRPGLIPRSRRARLRHMVTGSTLARLLMRVGFRGAVRRYMSVHEKGATIKATTAYAKVPGGPYLAIPLAAAMTARGAPKGRPGKFQNTFIGKTRAGKFFVFQRLGKKIRPLFRLQKEVTIPPRLQFFPTWRKTLPEVYRRLIAALKRGMQRPAA